MYNKICKLLDQSKVGCHVVKFFEDSLKKVLLDCQQCGDCCIQHAGFLCPESQCPKHMRNGACGGSRNGKCEVNPDSYCVWYRAYQRFAIIDKADDMTKSFVPPRMWELNKTSAWVNFHLGRDHQAKLS